MASRIVKSHNTIVVVEDVMRTMVDGVVPNPYSKLPGRGALGVQASLLQESKLLGKGKKNTLGRKICIN